ncbi:MAG: hypothetical protein H6732_11370 [Alphaproteobacteria bacterium]|nr:hypothetical protein [Alphaproteobacteria bacterium]
MRILCLGLLACGPPATFDADLTPDTDVVDTDPPKPPGPDCSGELALPMTGTPQYQQIFPITWDEQDADLTIGPFGSGRTYVTKEDDGCITIDSGALAIDLRGTKCAGTAVRISLESLCEKATCVEIEVGVDDERRGSTRSALVGTREVVELAPSQPFLDVRIAAVDFRVCAVAVTRTPIPEELRPPDTGEAF